NGIGPFRIILEEMEAMSSGCPVVTSNSSLCSVAEYPVGSGGELHPIDHIRKMTPIAEETPHPSLLKGH
ncbi:MAG: hypothetical protein ABIS18_04170, partial [Actinomycetota bacterium]